MQVTRQNNLPSTGSAPLIWVTIALAGWWVLVCWPLAGVWSTDPQYAYGWAVPPLALLLLWKRWRDRPIPQQSPAGTRWLIGVAAAVLLPGWLISQPNPGWRIVPWLLAVSAVAGSVGACGLLGGRPWMRHFAFPILFMLTAVPWPGFVEAPIVHGLMQFVASCTVLLLNLAGIPAMQRGNLVEIASGVLGVDEACSGVRSLQAAFMVALFLGELHRLRVGARIALVGAGFAAAMLTNIGRTSWLSFSAARNGMGAVGQWHDPAGYTVLTICLIALALLAEWMRPRFVRETGLAGADVPVNVLSWRPGVILAFWIIAVIGLTEAWYYRPAQSATRSWTLELPANAKQTKLPEATLELLGCDRTDSAVWRDHDGGQWQAYFLEWFPRRSRTAVLAQVHRPEVCLPSAGLTEAGPRRVVHVTAAGFDLAFESLHFRSPAGEDAYVFYCPWEIVPGTDGRNAAFSDGTRAASLRRVIQRERVVGQQVLELLATQFPSREAAEAALREQVARLVQPGVPK